MSGRPLTVRTGMFVADSTAARIAVLGSGFVVTAQYLRTQRKRFGSGPRHSPSAERDR